MGSGDLLSESIKVEQCAEARLAAKKNNPEQCTMGRGKRFDTTQTLTLISLASIQKTVRPDIINST